jgi:hypothetical protein
MTNVKSGHELYSLTLSPRHSTIFGRLEVDIWHCVLRLARKMINIIVEIHILRNPLVPLMYQELYVVFSAFGQRGRIFRQYARSF